MNTTQQNWMNGLLDCWMTEQPDERLAQQSIYPTIHLFRMRNPWFNAVSI
jgi:hypothetical protein